MTDISFLLFLINMKEKEPYYCKYNLPWKYIIFLYLEQEMQSEKPNEVIPSVDMHVTINKLFQSDCNFLYYLGT